MDYNFNTTTNDGAAITKREQSEMWGERYYVSEKITAKQIAYIIEHKDDRPRRNVARAVGISISTMYRYIRKAGGKMRMELATRQDKDIELVREHYPHMGGLEIDREYGFAHGRSNKIARKYGFTHSAETIERLRAKNVEQAKVTATKRDYAARAKRWKLNRRMDELRLFDGRPRKTRHRFRKTPLRTYRAKWHLIKEFGYIATDEPYTLAYDAKTRRRLGKQWSEDYYRQSYKLKFIQKDYDDKASD